MSKKWEKPFLFGGLGEDEAEEERGVLEVNDAGHDDEEGGEEEETCWGLPLPRLLLPNKGLVGLGEGVENAWVKAMLPTRTTVVVNFIVCFSKFPCGA